VKTIFVGVPHFSSNARHSDHKSYESSFARGLFFDPGRANEVNVFALELSRGFRHRIKSSGKDHVHVPTRMGNDASAKDLYRKFRCRFQRE